MMRTRVSLASRFVLATLIVGFGISAIATAALLWNAWRGEHAALQSRLNEIEHSVVPSLARSVWYVDHTTVANLLDGIERLPGVSRVELRTVDGDQWNRGSASAPTIAEKTYALRYRDGEVFELGSLRVAVNDEHIREELRWRVLRTATIVTLALAGCACVLFLLFHVWVNRPLAVMARYARDLDFDLLEQPLTLPGRDGRKLPDELDEVVTSFNLMRQTLIEYLGARTRHEVELIAHREHLEVMVDQRTSELIGKARELEIAHDNEQSARALAAHEAERFTDFAEVAADGFWETDAELKLTYVSAGFAQSLGLTRESMLGLTPEQAYRLRFPEATDTDAFMAPLRQRTAFREQLFATVDAEGKRRWLQNQGRPIFDDQGAFLGFRGSVRDITEQRRAEKKLRTLARIDALTELPNRLSCEERLAEAIARSQRSGVPMGVVFLDLDHFKAINDTLGHRAGDLVLQEFARRVSRSVRRTDFVARLAGDEFVIILEPLATANDAEIVAQKIIEAMQPSFDLEGDQRHISTTLGIAIRQRETDGADLLRRADGALYAAKAVRRGTFKLANPVEA